MSRGRGQDSGSVVIAGVPRGGPESHEGPATKCWLMSRSIVVACAQFPAVRMPGNTKATMDSVVGASGGYARPSQSVREVGQLRAELIVLFITLPQFRLPASVRLH